MKIERAKRVEKEKSRYPASRVMGLRLRRGEECFTGFKDQPLIKGMIPSSGNQHISLNPFGVQSSLQVVQLVEQVLKSQRANQLDAEVRGDNEAWDVVGLRRPPRYR